jgi:hypothetical protein
MKYEDHSMCLKLTYVILAICNVAILKRMKITGWRVKAEDREEWSKIVDQTKTHPEL